MRFWNAVLNWLCANLESAAHRELYAAIDRAEEARDWAALEDYLVSF